MKHIKHLPTDADLSTLTDVLAPWESSPRVRERRMAHGFHGVIRSHGQKSRTRRMLSHDDRDPVELVPSLRHPGMCALEQMTAWDRHHLKRRRDVGSTTDERQDCRYRRSTEACSFDYKVVTDRSSPTAILTPAAHWVQEEKYDDPHTMRWSSPRSERFGAGCSH